MVRIQQNPAALQPFRSLRLCQYFAVIENQAKPWTSAVLHGRTSIAPQICREEKEEQISNGRFSSSSSALKPPHSLPVLGRRWGFPFCRCQALHVGVLSGPLKPALAHDVFKVGPTLSPIPNQNVTILYVRLRFLLGFYWR